MIVNIAFNLFSNPDKVFAFVSGAIETERAAEPGNVLQELSQHKGLKNIFGDCAFVVVSVIESNEIESRPAELSLEYVVAGSIFNAQAAARIFKNEFSLLVDVM